MLVSMPTRSTKPPGLRAATSAIGTVKTSEMNSA
jgi:hypothetical protein